MIRSIVSRTSSLINKSSVNTFARRTYATDAGANEELLTFSFMVPHQVIFKDKKVQMITLPGAKSVMGVLKHHVPNIAELKPGVVAIQHDANTTENYFISGGFAFINPDASCYVNAVEAVPLDQIDPTEVKNGLQKYTQLYNEAVDEKDKAIALIGLETHQHMAHAVGVTFSLAAEMS
ncbi:ATP synthase F1 delta [Cavenderia fasciculata]|uniref:ATP synthase F1 delta n=1 Tax=Cavenderia fasciculata TaxID=261658 RepID=F4Q7D1_CACFS|nr:ATP synthase F1 delta [Cavenderia fasciculata]EGG16313.1 ATP synthase F1 delta [Cavenderia fasciculata]|eukprot:XP_004354697.1 ATP synthase F1 delta [Cavenderia fasciculata]